MSLENYLSAKSRDRHTTTLIQDESEAKPRFSIKDILARKSQQQQQVSDARSPQDQEEQPFQEGNMNHKSNSPINPYHNVGKILLQAEMMTKNSQSIFQSWKRMLVKLITSNETEGAVFAVYKDQESITASLQIIIPEIHSVQKTNYKSAFISRFGNGDARKSSVGFMIQLGSGDMVHFSCESVSVRDQFVDVLQDLIIQVQQYKTRLERLNYEQHLVSASQAQQQQMIDVYEFDQESRLAMSPTSFIHADVSESPVTQQDPPFRNMSPAADQQLQQPAPRRNLTAHFITHPNDIGFENNQYSESPDFTFHKIDDIEGESPLPVSMSPTHGGMVTAFQEDKDEINRIVDELKEVRDENERLRTDLESNRIMEDELSTIRGQLRRQQSLIRHREEQHVSQLAQQQISNLANDAPESNNSVELSQKIDTVSEKISDLHVILIDKHQKQIESIDALHNQFHETSDLKNGQNLNEFVSNLKDEIKRFNDPLMEILRSNCDTLKEISAGSSTGYDSKHIDNEKTLDSIACSLKEITKFLSKNADLQNRSEIAFHAKMDQLMAKNDTKDRPECLKNEEILDWLKDKLAKLDKSVELGNEIYVAGITKQSEQSESINEHITDEINKLANLQDKFLRDINNGSHNINMTDIERKLEHIQTALDQTQSMVLSGGNMSSSQQNLPLPTNELEALQKQIENLSSNMENSFDGLQSSVKAKSKDEEMSVESIFMREFREEIEAKLSNLDKNVAVILNATQDPPANMGLALLTRHEDRRLSSSNLIHGRPRSLTSIREQNGSRASLRDEDFDNQSVCDGGTVQDINRNLTNLKLRLNSFITSTLTDDKMQVISSQLNELKETSQKTRGNVQSLNDNLQSSDNAWRTELRHILRSYHEQMVKLDESVLQVTQAVKQHQPENILAGESATQSASNVDNEKLLERITQLLNNNYGMISEDLQQVQHTFSKSLNELMQDREILMRENQRLLTDVEQLKHNMKETCHEEDSDLAKLKEQKEKLTNEIDTQFKWLTSLQSFSKTTENEPKPAHEQDESLNRSRVQTLLTEIDALKIKRSIIGDIISIGRGPATPPNVSPKKRSLVST